MEGIGAAFNDANALRYANGIDRTQVSIGDGQTAQIFDNLLNLNEQLQVETEVQDNNRTLQIGERQIKQVMDKDDYLKLLITQLQNQDPTAPMEDREFIAQMAQFSSLEQMTNISNGFQSMAAVLSAGQATGMLGKEVQIIVNGNSVTGQVQEVTRGDFPQVLVDGTYYDISDVSRIREFQSEVAAAQNTALQSDSAAASAAPQPVEVAQTVPESPASDSGAPAAFVKPEAEQGSTKPAIPESQIKEPVVGPTATGQK